MARASGERPQRIGPVSAAAGRTHRAGIEAFTPDGIPVIGSSLALPGAFHPLGVSVHGFQPSSAAGRIPSELILDGMRPFPIEHYFRWTFRPGAVANNPEFSVPHGACIPAPRAYFNS